MAKYNEMGMRWCCGYAKGNVPGHWEYVDSFGKYKSAKDGLQPYCRLCQSERNRSPEKKTLNDLRYGPNADPNHAATYRACGAKNRADRIQRTPAWADLDKIKEIYKNRPDGHHVDHIVPLVGKNVSGLHVHYNLQYLTAEENLRKNNSYETGV